MKRLELKVDPVGKPRMTRRDKWKRRPVVERYNAYKDLIALQRKGFQLPNSFTILFYIPMPKSWSRKKKDQFFLEPHQSTPDIDNLIKAVLDAMLKEDKEVWNIAASKRWHVEGKIIIMTD